MKKQKEGTQQWFEHARRRCVDHLRALISVRMADDCMSAILTRWDSNDFPTAAGLHLASVIAYARPFTSALTKYGKVVYGISSLKKASGFDSELHSHILQLRNQLLAHSDYSLLASTMYLQTIGDEQLHIAMGVNVKIMFGLESKSLAERYRVHFHSCISSIEETLSQELKEVAKQAQQYPDEFNATHNVPVDTSEAKLSADLKDFPGPTGPASHVTEPSIPEGLSGYRYLTLQHKIALISSGSYTIHKDGVPMEVTFSVD